MATPKVGPSPSPSCSAFRTVSSCQDVVFLQLPESREVPLSVGHGQPPKPTPPLLEEGAKPRTMVL